MNFDNPLAEYFGCEVHEVSYTFEGVKIFVDGVHKDTKQGSMFSVSFPDALSVKEFDGDSFKTLDLLPSDDYPRFSQLSDEKIIQHFFSGIQDRIDDVGVKYYLLLANPFIVGIASKYAPEIRALDSTLARLHERSTH